MSGKLDFEAHKPKIPSKLRQCYTFKDENHFPKEEIVSNKSKVVLDPYEMRMLLDTLNLIANGKSYKKIMKNRNVKIIVVRSISAEFDQAVGKHYDSLKPDKCGFRFPMFHSTTYQEWKNTKSKVYQVIDLFDIEGLLDENNKSCSEIHTRIDCVMAYFILSLVHFKLFKNINQEFKFFNKLSISDTKTADCLNFIDKIVSEQLIFESSSNGFKEVLNRIYLRLGEKDAMYLNEVMYQDGLYRSDTTIHDYFHGRLLNTTTGYEVMPFIEKKLKYIEGQIREHGQRKGNNSNYLDQHALQVI